MFGRKIVGAVDHALPRTRPCAADDSGELLATVAVDPARCGTAVAEPGSTRMKFLRLVGSGLLLLAFVACSTNNPMATPAPAKSEYLQTQTGGFVFKRGQGG